MKHCLLLILTELRRQEATGVKDDRPISEFNDNEFEKLWRGIEQIESYKEREEIIMRLFQGLILLLFIPSYLVAGQQPDQLYVKAGNIYYAQTQLTQSGYNSLPVLSHDKKSIAFIKTSTKIIPERCRAFADTRTPYGEQIWIVNIEQKKEQLLVSNVFSCDKPTEMIVDPKQLIFSPDKQSSVSLDFSHFSRSRSS